MTGAISFIDLQAQRARLGAALTRAIERAVAGGQWILGPQVTQLEEQLSDFAGVKHTIACANGTDALHLILRAWNIGTGDAVFVPAFTFAATAEAVVLAGATPVFIDVEEDSFNLDPTSLDLAIAQVRNRGEFVPKAVISVDLFGQPVDYRRIEPICRRENLWLLCDAAQAFGATFDGKRTGAIGDAAATSFFPAKPLGCYGDGGACFTNDDALAESLRSLHMHGQGAVRYEHTHIGFNSRLDTIQAAILIEKLKIFPDEIEARERIARRYDAEFENNNRIRTPRVTVGARSVWAQYTLQVNNRDRLQAELKEKGIPANVYYPAPLSKQPAYRCFPAVSVPVAESLSKCVVSLPMHAYLDEATQDRIVAAVHESAG